MAQDLGYSKLMTGSMMKWSICLLLFLIISMSHKQTRAMAFRLKTAQEVGSEVKDTAALKCF